MSNFLDINKLVLAKFQANGMFSKWIQNEFLIKPQYERIEHDIKSLICVTVTF